MLLQRREAEGREAMGRTHVGIVTDVQLRGVPDVVNCVSDPPR